MKRYLPFVIIAAVAVLTVGASALLYHAKQRAYLVPATGDASAPKLNINPSHVRGDPDARPAEEVAPRHFKANAHCLVTISSIFRSKLANDA